jgi:hypothetical protein
MSLNENQHAVREQAVLRILHRHNLSPWARTYWARTYCGLKRAEHEAKVLPKRSH